MWWWFKKTKGKPSDDKRWASLAASLKLSFSQVKEDIDHLTSSDSSQNQKLDDVSRRMQLVESRLDSLYLLNVTRNHHLQQEIPERKETKQQTNPETTLHLIENLTDVQRAILMTLAQVTHEVPSHQISLRDLSLKLYPNKRYNDVRTMMSEYTDKLLEFGLINKKRKGREVVISLTDKTQQIYGGLAGQGNSFKDNLFNSSNYGNYSLLFYSDLAIFLFTFLGLIYLVVKKHPYNR